MRQRSHEDSVHFTGRLWMMGALVLFFAAPLVFCIYFDSWPELPGELRGLLGVAPIYWTVCTV